MDTAELKQLVSVGPKKHDQSAIRLGDKVHMRRGRIHEVTGASADMFALLMAARQQADVLWIGLRRDVSTLCPTGLQSYVSPERLIVVEAVSRGELLWATDQALRADGGFCVIAELSHALSLKESRRLQVAAEQGGGIGLIILRGPANTSAAQTRWECVPLLSEKSRWQWSCVKGKSGEAGTWQITCQGGTDAKDTLHMAATASA